MRARFLDLARALGEFGVWVRLHYVYPYPHVDEVIALMADGKVLPYLDIPFQHASPDVLRRMKRPAAQEKTLERIRRWREICPDLTIRSTFIVGFPGETEADFEILLDWLDEAELDRVGCFRYEPVAGAAANDLAAAGARRREGGALASFHAAPAGDLGAPPQAQGRHPPAGDHRRGRADGRQGPQQGATRRRSTARSMWRAGGRCASARSRPSRSSAPTPTICTGPRSGSDLYARWLTTFTTAPVSVASSSSPMVKAGVR